MRMSISIARPSLVSVGTCLGKFSKSGVFKLHITALDILAQYAKYKVWENTKLGGSEEGGGGVPLTTRSDLLRLRLLGLGKS